MPDEDAAMVHIAGAVAGTVLAAVVVPMTLKEVNQGFRKKINVYSVEIFSRCHSCAL